MRPVQFFAAHKDIPDAVIHHCSGFATMRDAWLSPTLRLQVAVWLAARVAGLPPVLAFDTRLVRCMPRNLLVPIDANTEIAAILARGAEQPGDVDRIVGAGRARVRLVIDAFKSVDPAVESKCLKWLRKQCPLLFVPGVRKVAARNTSKEKP